MNSRHDGASAEGPREPSTAPASQGEAATMLQWDVYAWLGFWRDQMPPDAVKSLQDKLGPLLPPPAASQEPPAAGEVRYKVVPAAGNNFSVRIDGGPDDDKWVCLCASEQGAKEIARALTSQGAGGARVYEVAYSDGCEYHGTVGLYARREDAEEARETASAQQEDAGVRYSIIEREVQGAGGEPSAPKALREPKTALDCAEVAEAFRPILGALKSIPEADKLLAEEIEYAEIILYRLDNAPKAERSEAPKPKAEGSPSSLPAPRALRGPAGLEEYAWEMVEENEPQAPNIYRVFRRSDPSIEATVCTLDTGEQDNEAIAQAICDALNKAPEARSAPKPSSAEGSPSSSLTWTREKPTRTGWYWFRGDHKKRESVVHVWPGLFGELRVFGLGEPPKVGDCEGEFAGPLPEPQIPAPGGAA